MNDVPPAPVLYAEDEENDIYFMNLAFERLPFPRPLQVTRNGREAIDYLAGRGPFEDRQKYPLPCLLLLDLNMPIRSGFDVLAWLRQQAQFQELPVVVFTASSHDSDNEKARQLGANEYVVKPNDMTQLKSWLANLRDRWLQKPGK